MRHSLPLILCLWLNWLIPEPAYGASPAPPDDCEVLDIDAIRKQKPEYRFPFRDSEALKICRLRHTGEVSFFLASAVSAARIDPQTNLCHHTSRRLFLSHDTPEEKRFTTDPPEGRSFLAEVDTHALVSGVAKCPEQYGSQYALIRNVSLEQFLIIDSRFKAETSTKETALKFWRNYSPENPAQSGIASSPDIYVPHQAVIKSIEIERSYAAPRLTRIAPDIRDHYRIIAVAETYSATVLFRFDGPNAAVSSAALFPKRQ